MNEKQSNVLSRLIDYADKKGLDIDIYNGCSESGYDDKMAIAADWNPDNMKRIGDFIERYFQGNIEIEWSDEWTGCSDCYKAVRTSPDSYGWERSWLWASDCEIVCQECYENSVDDIIEYYKNSTDRAVTSDLYQYLEKEGFVCFSPDEYCQRFETGWYPGQNDMPQDVAMDIENSLPEYDYIFKIDSVGQFDIQWSVYLRKQND